MIFPGDVVIKLAIEEGLQDLRNNPWIIDDIMGQFTKTDALKSVYGSKEVDSCRDWFLNNKIDVNLRFRADKDQFPCVTIALGSSNEMPDMKHLADLSSEVETLMPNDINKPISFIVKPFTPVSYSEVEGALTAPNNVSLRIVRPGMILVDPATGNGYPIIEVKGKIIYIAQDTELTANKFAVVPQYPFYRVRRGHSFFQETYSIGCHAAGDPLNALWLHTIVLYSLLRYRKTLLEGRHFTQSMISSSDLVPNEAFGGPSADNVFSRYITLTGMVQNSWINSPKRVIEAIDLVEREPGDVLKSGIKILSNLDSPASLDTEDDLWTTSDGEDEDDY